MKTTVLTLALALLAATLVASPALAASPAPQDATVQPPQPLAGKQSYAQNCATCHGDTGKGDGAAVPGLGVTPTALADYQAIADLPLTEWFAVTKNGRMAQMMPPWGKQLGDQEIWDTVGYAWTLHTSADQITTGEAVYAKDCVTCHGPDGEGASGPAFTDFTATSKVSQAAWAEVVAKGREAMPAFAGKLGDTEQRAALEYARSLSMGALFRQGLTPGEGVITGTVTNGTTGVPVANQIVTLSISDATSLIEERSATTDSAGGYRFDKLPTDPTLAYSAWAEYPAGLPYSTDPASFTSDKTAVELPIHVYETTTDGAEVSVDRAHYIIEFEPGRALIAELFLFSNDGDKTYIGDANGVLRFTLPPGYQDLSFNDGALGERYTATEDGFVDRWPLMPGQAVRQVLYRYTLPYSGKTLDLTRSTPYPAANVNALIADQGQRITSEQLANQGVRQTPNGNYISLAGQNLAANQAIAIRMTGLPDASGAVPSSQPSASRILTYVLVGAAGAAVVLLALWPLLRKRVALQTAEAAPDDRESILDALARLTVAHEAGEVSDSAFQRESLRLKAQLRDLTDSHRTR